MKKIKSGIQYLNRKVKLNDLTNIDNVVINLPVYNPDFDGATTKSGYGPVNAITMSNSNATVSSNYGSGSYGSGTYMESIKEFKYFLTKLKPYDKVLIESIESAVKILFK